MAKALFDASGNRALLFDTTNANESVNNQLKNECGVKRSSLITAIHRINGLQERHAADLLGVRSGVRTQYAVSTPPRSSLRTTTNTTRIERATRNAETKVVHVRRPTVVTITVPRSVDERCIGVPCRHSRLQRAGADVRRR